MVNRFVVSGLIACAVLGTTVYGQNAGNTTPAAAAAAPSMGLKDAYAGKFLIGCAGRIPGNLSDADLANIKANYNVITPENCMKPQPTHPSEDTYNWSRRPIRWSSGVRKTTSRSGVIPCSGTRRRATGSSREPTASRRRRELALERLKKHIKTVVGRYKGKIIGWDVVNESITDGGNGETENLRNSSWYRTVGPDVLTLAFKWAHEADPDAQLYYNDYNIEQGATRNTGKHASSLLLLKRLIKEGAPINGVGIQGHWHLDTNIPDVEKAILNYKALGLKVSISELDVTSTGTNSGAFGGGGGGRGGPIGPEQFKQQAEVFAKLFDIFNRNADTISRVTFWGLSDSRSWRSGQAALVFTSDLQPKPAFQAIIDVGQGKLKPKP